MFLGARMPARQLLSDTMQANPPLMRGVAMFPEIDALPGAEGKLALRYRNGQSDSSQSGANMRGHVVGPFGCVDESRIAVRHQAAEKSFQIAPHVWVGIFLDQKRGGSMADQQGQEPRLKAVIRHPSVNLISKLIKTAAAGRNPDFMNGLAQGNRSDQQAFGIRSKALPGVKGARPARLGY